MTNEQMLTELIELAVKNGFTLGINAWIPCGSELEFLLKDYERPSEIELLFNHEFAKAVFEDDDHKIIREGISGIGFNYPLEKTWQYHLQQLAITPEAERIKYAWEHRRKG